MQINSIGQNNNSTTFGFNKVYYDKRLLPALRTSIQETLENGARTLGGDSDLLVRINPENPNKTKFSLFKTIATVRTKMRYSAFYNLSGESPTMTKIREAMERACHSLEDIIKGCKSCDESIGEVILPNSHSVVFDLGNLYFDETVHPSLQVMTREILENGTTGVGGNTRLLVKHFSNPYRTEFRLCETETVGDNTSHYSGYSNVVERFPNLEQVKKALGYASHSVEEIKKGFKLYDRIIGKGKQA